MASKDRSRWMLLVGMNVLFFCVLSFYQPTSAAPQPFANQEEQRFEMIGQLKEIVAELKAQNALLRSGTLQVVVAPVKQKP